MALTRGDVAREKRLLGQALGIAVVPALVPNALTNERFQALLRFIDEAAVGGEATGDDLFIFTGVPDRDPQSYVRFAINASGEWVR